MSPAASPAQVSRTAAGDHEIAVPSLGLSLTQRRLLTLLDSPIAAKSLAERSGLPPEKFIRDLGRLASFRLVEGALPQDVLRGAAAGDTVTRAVVAMPAAVTIRPAANAESIAERGVRRTSGRRWLVPAAVVAIVALAAFGYWWLRGARESATAEPSAPLQAPAASAAQDAARSAAPGAAAESRQPVRRTAAERAAVTAAIAALRRSETQSIATNADAQQRAAATAAKVQSATRPETAPRTAPPATAAPVAVDRIGQTGQIAAQRTDEAPAASPTAAHSAAPAARSVVPSAAPTIPHRSEEPSAAAPTLAAPMHSAPGQPTPAHLAPPADAAPRIPIEAPAVLAPIARVAPEFPAEAIRRRIDSGRVRAQVTVDAGGHVTGVAIVSASPRGVFDDAVTTALGKWRFPAGAAGRKADVDVEFHRD